jgi:general secretion pathway protein N
MKHPTDDPQTAFAESTFRETTMGMPRTMRRMPPKAPRTPWAWAITGVLLGMLLCVLLFAPARWLTLAVDRVSGSQLQLINPRGSLWNGSAQLVLSAGEGSMARSALPGRFVWRIRPNLAGLQIDVTAPCCIQQSWGWAFKPRFSGFQLSMTDTPSMWPMAMLQGLGTPWNTLQLEGALTLKTEQLVLEWTSGRWAIRGKAQLNATEVATSLSQLRPVGSYTLTLTGGETASLALTTLQGPLMLSGQGQWVGGRLRFAGEATAEPQREAALVNLLNILGRRDGARSIIKVG